MIDAYKASYIRLSAHKYVDSREKADIAYENVLNHLNRCESTIQCDICDDLLEKYDMSVEEMKKAFEPE